MCERKRLLPAAATWLLRNAKTKPPRTEIKIEAEAEAEAEVGVPAADE